MTRSQILLSLLFVSPLSFSLTAMERQRVQVLQEEQATVCAICQTVLPQEVLPEHPHVTLACNHTQHRSCLTQVYKTVLIGQPHALLGCIVCRQALTQEDLAQFDLTITTQDVLHFLFNRILSLLIQSEQLTEERITSFKDRLKEASKDKQLVADISKLLDLSPRSTVQLMETTETILPRLSLETLQSGQFLDILKKIFDTFVSADQVDEAVHALIRHFGITEETLNSVIRTIIEQSAAYPQFHPIILGIWQQLHAPLSRLVQLVDRNVEINPNNPVLLVVQRVNLAELKKVVIRRSLPKLIEKLKELGGKFDQASFAYLVAPYVLFHTLEMYINRERTVPALREMLGNLHHLELNPEALDETVDLLSDFIANRSWDRLSSVVERFSALHPDIYGPFSDAYAQYRALQRGGMLEGGDNNNNAPLPAGQIRQLRRQINQLNHLLGRPLVEADKQHDQTEHLRTLNQELQHISLHTERQLMKGSRAKWICVIVCTILFIKMVNEMGRGF